MPEKPMPEVPRMVPVQAAAPPPPPIHPTGQPIDPHHHHHHYVPGSRSGRLSCIRFKLIRNTHNSHLFFSKLFFPSANQFFKNLSIF